jgi:hypothetical protein
MGSRSETIRTESILPTFRGVFLERFLRLVESIDKNTPLEQREAICLELEWCRARQQETQDRLKYQALLLVLRDLMGQGWQTRFRQRSIFLARPDYTKGKHRHLDPAAVKDQIRSGFRDERLSKINTPSTVRFIHSVEHPPKGKLPVSDLIADGEELARVLRELPPEPQIKDLRKAISPYLQLVRGDNTRDEFSNLKLLDIWRYFRYSWAIPFQPTPGRNLFYLVRDGARPNHPVVGIAALGNCVVQLSERDQAIGWNIEAIHANLERRSRTISRDMAKGSPVPRINEIEFLETEREHSNRVRRYASKLAESMNVALQEEFRHINLDALATRRDFNRPSEAVIKHLLDIAVSSERERQDDLRRTHEKGESVKRTEKSQEWDEETTTPLFMKKRAQAIADILFARLIFRREGLAEAPLDALNRLLQTDDGRKALRIALHSNKKAKIGCNMMDIIVCGAVPPYSELLGGKLVAMLMASPQVIAEYREVYGEQPSQIASRVAGRAVIRSAELVFLSTTSLYHVGSSQYERIRIPGPRKREIAYQFIGHTEGYGPIVLSSEATDCLREVATREHGMRRVNNIFGEGVSPRLRVTREGLALIGIPQELVLRHNCPRLIYGVQLASNAFEYLRGEASEPDYVFPPEKYREGTEAIVNHWLNRWLLPRSRRPESLEKLEQFDRDELRLSRELTGTGLIPEADVPQEIHDVRYG